MEIISREARDTLVESVISKNIWLRNMKSGFHVAFDYQFRTFVRKIQPLVIRNLRPGSNFEERAFAVVRADSIYGASPFSGGGPRWYRGEA